MNEHRAQHTAEEVLSCAGLYKYYNEGARQVDVLNGIDLSIKRGETIAIVGASGSGKSTLLHLLGGLDIPSRGTASFMGKDMVVLTDLERDQIRNNFLGFVYQFHHLLAEFTAIENVAMPLLISDHYNIEKAARSAEKMLAKVGLEKRLHHKPGELSGGEKQRTAIARALINQPQCILADEPTGNLDEKTAEQIFNLMLELRQDIGTSLVMVTHNAHLANKADQIYQLHDGLLQS